MPQLACAKLSDGNNHMDGVCSHLVKRSEQLQIQNCAPQHLKVCIQHHLQYCALHAGLLQLQPGAVFSAHS
jgi:hypothetical protein